MSQHHDIYRWTGEAFGERIPRAPELGAASSSSGPDWAAIDNDFGDASVVFELSQRVRDEQEIGPWAIAAGSIGDSDARGRGFYRAGDSSTGYNVEVDTEYGASNFDRAAVGRLAVSPDTAVTAAEGYQEPHIALQKATSGRLGNIFPSRYQFGRFSGAITIHPIEGANSHHTVTARFLDQTGGEGRLHSVERTQGSPLPTTPDGIRAVLQSALIGEPYDRFTKLTDAEARISASLHAATISGLFQAVRAAAAERGDVRDPSVRRFLIASGEQYAMHMIESFGGVDSQEVAFEVSPVQDNEDAAHIRFGLRNQAGTEYLARDVDDASNEYPMPLQPADIGVIDSLLQQR